MSLTKITIYRIDSREQTRPQFIRGLGREVIFTRFHLDHDINRGEGELAVVLSGNGGEGKATSILTLPDKKIWRIHRNALSHRMYLGGLRQNDGPAGHIDARDITDKYKSRPGKYEKMMKKIADVVSREIGMTL